jgi:DNA-directed RNA polymerase subunit M/transcription elongation factor TFIIS
MYRSLGSEVLSKYISNERTVQKIENKIHNISSDQEEYKKLLLEMVDKKRGGYSSKSIMECLKTGEYLDNRVEYKDFKNKIEEHDKFLVKPFEVDEGVLECGKCGSNKTISYTKQTRSGDEATSVFALCYQCNNKWKM